MVSRPGNIETPIWGNPHFQISFRRWRLFLKKLDFLACLFNNGLTLRSVSKVIFVFKYAFYDGENGFWNNYNTGIIPTNRDDKLWQKITF